MASSDDFSRMPKVELHRHLEGAIRPSTILDLFRKNRGMFWDLSVDDIAPRIQIGPGDKSFLDFLAKFEFFMPCIASEADLSRITREAIEDCASDGIVYAELRFAPIFVQGLTGLSPARVVEAVLEGARETPPGIDVSFILIIPQPEGERAGWETVRLARDYMDSGVRGIDIAADTRQVGLREYIRPLAWARSSGLGVTVHAGESEGPESVRIAVSELGATRVGHGIRAVEDGATLALLVERGTVLEVCPTSNVHTRVVPSIEAHPLMRLMEAGVRVTLNTDDPGISGITLSHEYRLARQVWGVDPGQFGVTNHNALEAAFATPAQRTRVAERIAGQVG
ncbi:MAG: adenosine deaminase [Firmicutes bacterium]|nr:adenosine deaminase [Bacillota bacterium]